MNIHRRDRVTQSGNRCIRAALSSSPLRALPALRACRPSHLSTAKSPVPSAAKAAGRRDRRVPRGRRRALYALIRPRGRAKQETLANRTVLLGRGAMVMNCSDAAAGPFARSLSMLPGKTGPGRANN